MSEQDTGAHMCALIEEIARILVDEPDHVEVTSMERDDSSVIRLKVAPNDIGKVIGKQGRTARSMRTILGAASMKYRHRFTLDIIEEHKQQDDGQAAPEERGAPGHGDR
jgi:predicted RNA-binding protein YlqC (UPF0109 family)